MTTPSLTHRFSPAMPGTSSYRDRAGSLAGRVGLVALVTALPVAIGAALALADDTAPAFLLIAVGLAVAPVLIYVAAELPAVAIGLFVALQLVETLEVQSPVGTLSFGILLLALILAFHLSAFLDAFRTSRRVRVAVMLLLVWLASFGFRLVYAPPNDVARDLITSVSFAAIVIVGIAIARRNRALLAIAIGATCALIVLGVFGALASEGIIPHPSRQWQPEFRPRALLGFPSPFIRNYGLDLPFDSIALLLPLSLPYLAMVIFTPGRRGRLLAATALGVVMLIVVFVFQSRDMLVQAVVASMVIAFIYRPRLAALLLILAIPYAISAVGHLESVDQVSSSLRKVQVERTLSTVATRPQTYLLGTDERKVVLDNAASVGEAGALINQKDTHIHSFFLSNLVAGGWLAFAALLGLFAYGGWWAFRSQREKPGSFNRRVLVVAMAQVLFVVAFEPVTASVVGSWLVLGLVIGSLSGVGPGEDASAPEPAAPNAPRASLAR